MILQRDKTPANVDLNMYHHKQSWFQIARPLTWTGTISPIIVGTTIASYNESVRLDTFFVLIVAAVCVQAAANIWNDYFDFVNGQDKEKWYRQTEGSCEDLTGPAHNQLPYVALGLLVIAAMLGLWLAINSHFIIILIGIAGIFAGYKYSAGGHHSLSALGFGEITAAIFLGFVPVLLVSIIQGQTFNIITLFISILFALLISMMILTNNIRDIHKDEGFRKTIAIRVEKKRALLLLKALSFCCYLLVTILIISHVFPWTTLIVFLAIPIVYQLLHAYRKESSREEQVRGMKLVSQHHWAFSILLIIGLIIGYFIR